MLTLSLLRHAKSSWDDEDLSDFDRPLSRRGIEAVPLVAGYLMAHRIKPQIILCSSARRATESLDLLLSQMDGDPHVAFEDGLYLASPAALLARLRKVVKANSHVMIIGHNPGLHAFALDLVSQGRRDDIAALGRKLPTAGLVVINFNLSAWADVHPALGALRLYVTPARIA